MGRDLRGMRGMLLWGRRRHAVLVRARISSGIRLEVTTNPAGGACGMTGDPHTRLLDRPADALVDAARRRDDQMPVE